MRLLTSIVALAACLLGTTAAAQQVVGPFKRGSYPTEVVLRPLTLPERSFRVDLAAAYGESSAWTILGPVSANLLAVVPAISYGVTDRLELGAQVIGVGTMNSFSNDATLSAVPRVSATYAFVDTGALDFAGHLGFAFAPNSGAAELTLGAPLRLAFNDRVALRFADTVISAVSNGDFVASLPVVLQTQLSSVVALELGTTAITFDFGRSDVTVSPPRLANAGLVFVPHRNLDLRVGGSLPLPGNAFGGYAVNGAVAYRF